MFVLFAASSGPSIGRAIERHFRADTHLQLDPRIEDELIRLDAVEAFGSVARTGGPSIKTDLGFRVE